MDDKRKNYPDPKRPQKGHHHHHHVTLSAQISLTLSRHPSLSSIASGSIGTELLYLGSSWSSCLCTSMWMGPVPNNYRSITCPPIMWKMLTTQIREETYYSLISRGLFPEEQKGCCKGTRVTGHLQCVDQDILKESKMGRKNLAMALIDNKEAYDMVKKRRKKTRQRWR